MTRVERWEHRTAVPLALLGIAFVAAFAWPILQPGLTSDTRLGLQALAVVVWVGLAIDFAVRLHLAENRRAYARKHWYDVLLIALPMLQGLRVLSLLALIRLVDRSATRNLGVRVMLHVVDGAILTVLVGSVAVLGAERDAPGATITSFGDALWWSIATITTVGYGDLYPVTVPGRLIASVVMLLGMTLLGVGTAGISSWLITKIQEQTRAQGSGSNQTTRPAETAEPAGRD